MPKKNNGHLVGSKPKDMMLAGSTTKLHHANPKSKKQQRLQAEREAKEARLATKRNNDE